MQPATLLKKRLWCRCFLVNFVIFLRTPFLTEHLRWLLLYLLYIRLWCIFTFQKWRKLYLVLWRSYIEPKGKNFLEEAIQKQGLAFRDLFNSDEHMTRIVQQTLMGCNILLDLTNYYIKKWKRKLHGWILF